METLEIKPEPNSPVIFEQDQRLSHSMLWELQREFFARQGVEAWRQGTVPHYITSNPFIASAYARVVLGFLRDCQAGSPPLNPGQPVYIIELGAGSGRFAFHFLKKFLAVFTRSPLKHIRVKYVMTDFAQKTLDYWREHPSLAPWVEQGWLDFARFDAGHDRELRLRHAGERLAPGGVSNPLVVLANYVFDGLPQDAFVVQAGQLCESLVSLTSPQGEADLSAPDLLDRLEIAYAHRPLNGAYYADPDWEDILRDYGARLADTAFLFPCAALGCLRNLSALSNGCLLLLSADKGYSREEDLLGRGEPGLARHGSFSMMVNYHALGQYVRGQGGQVLGGDRRHNSMSVSAFILGAPPGGAVETGQAFAAAVEQFGPDDFYTLKKGIEKIYDTLTLPQLLAYLRLSRWDANILQGCFPTLLDRVDSLSEAEREALYEAIQQVWDTYYPLGEKRDLAFELGMLLYGMTYYADALDFFQHSLRLYGPDLGTVYNMGMCHYGLGRLEDALAWVDQALELDPAFGPARDMRIRLQWEINRATGRTIAMPGTPPGLRLPKGAPLTKGTLDPGRPSPGACQIKPALTCTLTQEKAGVEGGQALEPARSTAGPVSLAASPGGTRKGDSP
jgi:tetratricopeptide (TPR) repeat protein